MGDNVCFSMRGWDDYTYWQTEDRRTIKKVNKIIKDIFRKWDSGIGKPEPLKGNLSGYWSREIDEKNRVIYRVKDNGDVEIVQCKGHYDDR